MRKGWRQQPLVLGKHPDQTRWEGHVSRPQIPNVVSGVDPRPLPQAPERRAECSEEAGGFGNSLYMNALVTSVGLPWAEVARWSASTCTLCALWHEMFTAVILTNVLRRKDEEQGRKAKCECRTNWKYPLFYRKWHPQMTEGMVVLCTSSTIKPPIWSQDLVCQSKKEDAWRNISSSPKQIPSS